MTRIQLQDSTDFLDFREGSGGTVEIYNIQVGSERRVGRGSLLLRLLIAQVRGQTHLIFALTRQSNSIAQEFYRAVGFRQLAVLPGFYSDENAVMYGLNV